MAQALRSRRQAIIDVVDRLGTSTRRARQISGKLQANFAHNDYLLRKFGLNGGVRSASRQRAEALVGYKPP